MIETRRCHRVALTLTAALSVAAFSSAEVAEKAAAQPRGKAPTAAEAKAFVDEAEATLLALSVEASRAGWVQSTYITDDTEALAAKANALNPVPVATSRTRSVPVSCARATMTARLSPLPCARLVV